MISPRPAAARSPASPPSSAGIQDLPAAAKTYGTEHAIFKLDELFRKEQPRQYKEKDDGDQPFYKRESKKSAVPHSFGQGLLRVTSRHFTADRSTGCYAT